MQLKFLFLFILFAKIKNLLGWKCEPGYNGDYCDGKTKFVIFILFFILILFCLYKNAV